MNNTLDNLYIVREKQINKIKLIEDKYLTKDKNYWSVKDRKRHSELSFSLSLLESHIKSKQEDFIEQYQATVNNA